MNVVVRPLIGLQEKSSVPPEFAMAAFTAGIDPMASATGMTHILFTIAASVRPLVAKDKKFGNGLEETIKRRARNPFAGGRSHCGICIGDRRGAFVGWLSSC
jgi:hypothetical protein